jgi:hypothetical protein
MTGARGGQSQATARTQSLLVEILRAATAALLHRPSDYSVFWLLSRVSSRAGQGRQAGVD